MNRPAPINSSSERNLRRHQRLAESHLRTAAHHIAGLDIGRKMFLHINNSNPALLHGSDERKAAEQAGWHIPADGMEITL